MVGTETQSMLTFIIISMILEELPIASMFINPSSDNLFYLMCCPLDYLKSELNMVVSSVLKIYYRVGRKKKPVFENVT